jgi:hypothetical protein
MVDLHLIVLFVAKIRQLILTYIFVSRILYVTLSLAVK